MTSSPARTSSPGSTAGPGLLGSLEGVVGARRLHHGDAVSGPATDWAHDEALGVPAMAPAAVVEPVSADEVAEVLGIAAAHGVPVTARGSGTGLSGAATPVPGGLVVSFGRMNRILEIDTENHVAVVEPGVTLAQLDEATAAHGLCYPVQPGEYGASLGGNVATNAGGMRAVRYGVTRSQVLGLQAVLPTGEVIRTGGKVLKASTGYDLTQLITGSEGTLALVTEATLRVYPRLPHQATVLAPYDSVDEVSSAVPRILGEGVAPLVLEYLDRATMDAITDLTGLDLGVDAGVRRRAEAFLLVVLEGRDAVRLEEDTVELGGLLEQTGAIETYVLPGPAARRLVEAREKAFWAVRARGAREIVDIVVPRASVPELLRRAAEISGRHEARIAGCGHAGDGNVHLSVFAPEHGGHVDGVLHDLFAAGAELGGLISGEHGVGRGKAAHFAALTDPTVLALMRRLKQAFDPRGLLNPGVLFGPDGSAGPVHPHA